MLAVMILAGLLLSSLVPVARPIQDAPRIEETGALWQTDLRAARVLAMKTKRPLLLTFR